MGYGFDLGGWRPISGQIRAMRAVAIVGGALLLLCAMAAAASTGGVKTAKSQAELRLAFKRTDHAKMQDIKLHHLNHIAMGTSQLQQNSTGTAESANSTSAADAPTAPKAEKKDDGSDDDDDDDDDARAGFW